MAWRNIWRNKMRSMIIISSIAFGLFAGIAVLSLYKGLMDSRIKTVIYSETGHIQIHAPRFKEDYDPVYFIPNGNRVVQQIKTIPGIKLVIPRSITTGMLSTATGSAGVQINGVIPTLEYEGSSLKEKIIEGKGFSKNLKNEVLIGKKLADKMKLKLRSRLVLTFTDTAGNIVSGAFKIKGIYRSDNSSLDEKNVYVHLQDLNSLLGTGNDFQEIVLLLNSDSQVIQIREMLKRKYPQLKIESWRQVSPETDLLVKTTDQYSYIIMVIIMVALAFGIINTMLMAILERTREIGMMLALGTVKLRIFLLILLETTFLTITGVPAGILLAWLVISFYNRQGLDLSGMGAEMMSSFGFSTLIYPDFPADKLGGVLLIVIFTALLSCILPALKALNLAPAEALRK